MFLLGSGDAHISVLVMLFLHSDIPGTPYASASNGQSNSLCLQTF